VNQTGLTLDRVAHYPLPGTNAPAAVRFSPDGRYLTYLWSEDGTLVRQLWGYEIETGETKPLVRAEGPAEDDTAISTEETLRRERQRQRGLGVTSYEWAERAPVLLVPLQGRLLLSEDFGATIRPLETGGAVIDPHLSPAGDAVAYVQDGELWLTETRPGATPRRLTFDASPPGPSGERPITNGLADYIAQEEMGRSSGFWWSRDGTRLAFTQVDLSPVPAYTIAHDSEDPPTSEIHRYPFAGAPNARVRLGIVGRDGSRVQWVPLDLEENGYLARVDWAPDGTLYFQRQDRSQRRLDLVRFDPASGESHAVLTETAATWVNLHDDLRFIERSGDSAPAFDLLWSSERSGYRHLYVYTATGELIVQLTRGDWPVDRVVGYHGGWVYFLASRDTPLQRHLYRVRADGPPEQLTDEAGMHGAVLAPSGAVFADLWDSRLHAPALHLRHPDDGHSREVFRNRDNEAEALDLAPPELLTVAANDGTTLYAALYHPRWFDGGAPPLIVSVYGGPHVQQVNDSWGLTADLRAQFLAQHGYAVLKLDNRGSARRGHPFEAAILGNLGDLEVQDQVAGVRAVLSRFGLDPARVGVYGWSYGGYMALMCLLRAPEVFRAAVAGAPVTDWDGYDTHYTERYMRTPQANPEGYRSSSALTHAPNLEGDLLLIHGMIDENVHFRHTVRLVDALIAAAKSFRLLPFPHERHMPRREEDRRFMEGQVFAHFERSLGLREPEREHRV
jgi:dipeptidyl-peptidase-4